MTIASKQVPLFPLLLSNFIGTLGFSIVLPFLVFLVIGFGGNSIVYGILAAIYPSFQLIGAPILGKWSDTSGRKKVLLLSNGGTLVGWMIFLFALLLPVSDLYSINSVFIGSFVITLPLVVLFFARALDGITGGNVSVANAYLADVSTDENRSKNFGKMSISSNLGFILGPALAGILGGTIYKEILPVIAAVVVSSVALVIIGFTLKESKPISASPSPEVGSEIQVSEKKNISKVFSFECKQCYSNPNPKNLKFKDIFRLKHITYLLVLYFFIFLGFNIYYTSFPIHVVSGLKWSITDLGIFYSALGGIMILVQGPVLRKALKKLSEEKLVIIGSVILSVNFSLFMANNTILAYGALILF